MVREVAMGHGVSGIDEVRTAAVSETERAQLAFTDTDDAPADLTLATVGPSIGFTDLLPEIAVGAVLVIVGCFAVRHRRIWA